MRRRKHGRRGPKLAFAVAVLLAAAATAACAGSEPPTTSSPPLDELGVENPPPSADVPAPSLRPAAPARPVTMTASPPVRLEIPRIGIDSPLMDLGLAPDGTLEVPPDGFPAGWYTGAPTPGELGPAIIAGHVDWEGQAGVFFDLRELAPGDTIAITRADGSTARFQVSRVERFAKDAFPTDAVYGDLDHAGLRLITCGGDFDQQARSYTDNIVVFAELRHDPPAQR